MERHRALVQKISSTVRAFYNAKEPYRIFHGSTNSTRPQPHGRGARVVDISALRDVLSVDASKRTALVEPNVPMDRLVETTLKHGLVPPVVMEFPGITAGGGFAGTAGESSSFKHGFFDDTVASVEVVLPDGEVVTAANPNTAAGAEGKHADLFRGAAGAVGTLGVTTLLELNLVAAKKFVRTRYRRTGSVAEAVAAVREETARAENDYVDGILFSKDHGVVITGQMTDEKPAAAPVRTFSRARDPWFYMHVQERTASPSPSSSPSSSSTTTTAAASSEDQDEYIPLAEYLFRYDRAGFWVGRAGWTYFKLVPFNALMRWFLDDFLHTRMLYRALHGSGESARFIVQDVAMPFSTTADLVDYTSDELGIWPLWLCPLKRRAPPTFHPYTTTPGRAPEEKEDDMMLNVGVWGWGPEDHGEFVRANRALEAKVRELGGMKWLYAHTYYDEPEFWDMYGGREWYDALRGKYKADEAGLPSVYDKVKVDLEKNKSRRSGLKSVWPFGGIYGIYKSIKSKDYVLHRDAGWKWKGEE
ncbi:fad binding domain-containing protein [Diaporthe amygdali]|uniref:fad binding domain-containing protein n=1 Tax=Phomopsis amygdali TaxID=1214568 RepID=UPI0022FEAEF2|nr:fad binding domain-containing protein [Diaporthe amygdali]KAJ0119451.1 fad binding domain-containing protein [Diaporthe amygdali]